MENLKIITGLKKLDIDFEKVKLVEEVLNPIETLDGSIYYSKIYLFNERTSSFELLVDGRAFNNAGKLIDEKFRNIRLIGKYYPEAKYLLLEPHTNGRGWELCRLPDWKKYKQDYADIFQNWIDGTDERENSFVQSIKEVKRAKALIQELEEIKVELNSTKELVKEFKEAKSELEKSKGFVAEIKNILIQIKGLRWWQRLKIDNQEKVS